MESGVKKVLAAGIGVNMLAQAASALNGPYSGFDDGYRPHRDSNQPDYNPNAKVHMRNRKKRKIAKKSKRINRKK